MNIPFLLMKLQPPPARRELVMRPRLNERLSTGLCSEAVFTRKVTLISASAGSGKTTLAADWLRRSRYPYAWLSLDENDNEPRRFLEYLVAAFQQLSPEVGQAALNQLENPQAPARPDFLAGLLSETAGLDGCFILVLDDFHTIHAKPIHQFLNFLIEYQPVNLHLFLLTREDPPIPISRLRARGQLLEIRQTDLRFSMDECTRFLKEAMRLDLSLSDMESLERRTEGWAAGLQLAALALQNTADPSDFIKRFTGSNRYILDYLLDEVLNKQPAPVQEFLLKTSILNRLSGPLCDSVTEGSGCEERLRALEDENLFLIPLDQTRTWYRYHRLFAELLRHRLRLQDHISEVELHLAASRWFEENQFLYEAVRHALEAEDWPRAANLIRRQSDDMLKSGEIMTLIQWCSSLPERILHADPRLCLTYAWPLLLASQYEPAEMLIGQAKSLAGENSTLEGDIAAAEAFLAQVLGDIDRMMQASERALSLLPSENLSGRSVVALNLGIAYWHSGQMDAADRALQEALENGLKTGNLYAAATAQIFLARSLAVRGQLQQAARSFHNIIETLPPMPVTTIVYLDLATLFYEWNDLEQAERQLVHGMQAASKSNNLEFQIAAHLLTARLQAAQADLEGMGKSIREAFEIEASKNVPSRTRDRIRALKVEYAWANPAWFEEVEDLPEDVDAHPFYRSLGLAQIRAHLNKGEKNEAAIRLEAAAKKALGGGWGFGRVVLLTLQALAAEPFHAMEYLSQALDQAHTQGYTRTFVDAGPQLIDLLKQAARQGIYPDTVGRILDAFRDSPRLEGKEFLKGVGFAQPDFGPQQLVEPLTERELEVLRLLAAGLSNQEIADQLVISINTAKSHVFHICAKLEATNRTQAVARAQELKLI